MGFPTSCLSSILSPSGGGGGGGGGVIIPVVFNYNSILPLCSTGSGELISSNSRKLFFKI